MSADLLDTFGRPVVAITGVGVVTSLGRGVEDNWAALTQGRSGIHRITRFPTDNLRTTIAGTVDFMDVEPWSGIDLSYALAEAAGTEAIESAGLDARRFDAPLFLAAPPIELEWSQRLYLDSLPDAVLEDAGYDRLMLLAARRHAPDIYRLTLFGGISERLADSFGTRGLPVTLSTACASGATAIQLGIEAIRRGETPRAIAIGTDGSVGAEALIRFSLLSALTTANDAPEKASRPFSKDRNGFVMAEGAGAVVLESLESARARGAEILGIMLGHGESADDFHRTRSKPDATPIVASIQRALADAGLRPEDIGYINAHGTSTPENDRMEYTGLSKVFGDTVAETPISSNKSMIGHTLTAAGAIEAVFSTLTLARGVLPPTINYDTPDPAIPLDTVPNTARTAEAATALSNSFGFGGQNVSLVVGRAPRD